ncbi:MAG: hypothetical protein QM760_15015 [Nibricoccus sp.]
MLVPTMGVSFSFPQEMARVRAMNSRMGENAFFIVYFYIMCTKFMEEMVVFSLGPDCFTPLWKPAKILAMKSKNLTILALGMLPFWQALGAS